MLETILKILQSKYVALLIGLGMCFAVPYTYKGMTIAMQPLAIAVFVMNVITVGLCFYSFFSKFTSKKSQPTIQQEW